MIILEKEIFIFYMINQVKMRNYYVIYLKYK